VVESSEVVDRHDAVAAEGAFPDFYAEFGGEEEEWGGYLVCVEAGCVSWGVVMGMVQIRLTLRLVRWTDCAMELVGGEKCPGICMWNPLLHLRDIVVGGVKLGMRMFICCTVTPTIIG
jgi:hypothetical protein